MLDEIPELVAAERELGLRGSLLDFVDMSWEHVEPGQPFLNTWHLGLLAEHYEACLRGEIHRLVVNIPPGMSKSLTTCVFFPTWVWIRNPSLRFLFASNDIGLTTRDAGRSLQLMQTGWFKERWGDRVILPRVPPVREIENSAKGWRFATSLEGKAVGRHADFQIIDDPIKPKGITKTTLEEARNWMSNTLASRWRKPGLECRILIMQRLHTDDLAQHMIDEGAVHLNLPMEFEPTARCETKWGFDKRTEDGELLCPERFNEAAVATLKKDMGGMVAAAQLQQRPVPEGGAVFQRAWFKHWTVMPSKFHQVLMSVDCTFKDALTSDYVVIQVWGRVGPTFYLLDQVRARMGFEQTMQAVKSVRKKWPRVTGILIEDKANGSAVIEMLSKEISGVIAIDPQGGKEARASAIAPLIEAGDVQFPDPNLPGYEWVNLEYEPELAVFPMGRNDDQVDGTSQALNYMHQKRSYLTEAMKAINGRIIDVS